MFNGLTNYFCLADAARLSQALQINFVAFMDIDLFAHHFRHETILH